MKIFVTGGAGFVGSHVAEHFAEQDEVVVCDNLARATMLNKSSGDELFNWNYLKAFGKVTMVKADIRDIDVLGRAARDSDVIIHTAAQVAVTSSVLDPKTDFEVNLIGTFNVLETARLNDSAVVFCSTNKVYGNNVNSIPVDEQETRYVLADHKFDLGVPESFPIDHTGHSPYGSSKLAADIYVQDYAYTYGLKTGVFRMSCIYGQRQFGVEDQGWLAWFAIANHTGKPIVIYGDGKQVRDVLYVTDLVRAFDSFLTSGIKHDVFNIGGGPENTLSLLEVLRMLREMTDRNPKVSFTEWRPSDQKVYVSDIRKITHSLKWRPLIDTKEGVKRVVEWVQTMKF